MIESFAKILEIDRKKIKIFLWSILIFLMSIVGVSFYPYYRIFSGKSEFVTDITLWGYFGDFWWNLIIAIASILNLIAFVVITLIVAKIGENQSESALETETFLTATQIKMDCVLELQKQLSSIITIGFDKDIITRKLNLGTVKSILLSFKNAYLDIVFSNSGFSEINVLIETTEKMIKSSIITADDINSFIKQKDILLKVLLKKIHEKVQTKSIDYIGIGVGAVIINNKNKILLLKRIKEPEKGYWTIPGGAVKFGETVEDAIIREVMEEIGIEIKIISLLGVTNHILIEEKMHWVSPAFLAEIVSGKPENKEPKSHKELKWFSLDSLPANSTITTRVALKNYLKFIDTKN